MAADDGSRPTRDDSNEDRVTSKQLSRRNWLQIVGASTVVGVAGCSSEENPATATDTPADTPTDTPGKTETKPPQAKEPVDGTLSHTATYNRKKHGFNLHNPKTNTLEDRWVFGQPLAKLNTRETKWVPSIAKEWSFEGETAQVVLDDRFKWSNGDPITAADLRTYWSLRIHAPGGHDYFDGVSVVDDKTLEYSLKKPELNDSLTKRQALDVIVFEPKKVYGEFAKRMRDASSEDAKKQVQKDLQAFEYQPKSLGGDFEPSEILSSGPFKLEEVTNKRIVLSPNEHHPVGSGYNFDYELKFVKNAEAGKSMMQANELDLTISSLSDSFKDTLPENWVTYPYPAYGGNSIDFQLNHEVYDDRRVRQALNYMIDQKQVAKATPSDATANIYNTGMADFVAKSWLGKETLEQTYTTYDQDFDKAKSLLKGAGFEQSGDKWLTPSGKEFQFRINIAASNTNRIKESQVAVQHCKDFGIKAGIQTIEDSAYWSMYGNRGNWETGVMNWAFGDRGRSHPYYDYGVYMYIGESADKKPWNMQPDTVEVPYPIGNPDGDLKEVNVKDVIATLRTANSRDEEVAAIKELGWIWNQYMPKIPTTNTMRAVQLTNDDWNIPSKAYMETRESRHVPFMLQEGRLTAKSK